MADPLISIVLPTYKAGKFLAETVQSVLAQSERRWELVIIDDGSPDNSADIARAFDQKDARVHAFCQPNGGESAARNSGYSRIARVSRYVIFLDHDDIWEPNALECLLNGFDVRPNIAATYAVGTFMGQNGELTRPGECELWCRTRKKIEGGDIVDCAPSDLTTLATLAYHPTICTMGVCLFRREALPAAPLFREDMKTGSADVHLYLRIARTWNYAFIDRVIIRKRIHESNITGNWEATARSLEFAIHDVSQMKDTDNRARAVIQKAFGARKSLFRRQRVSALIDMLGHGRIRGLRNLFTQILKDLPA